MHLLNQWHEVTPLFLTDFTLGVCSLHYSLIVYVFLARALNLSESYHFCSFFFVLWEHNLGREVLLKQ